MSSDTHYPRFNVTDGLFRYELGDSENNSETIHVPHPTPFSQGGSNALSVALLPLAQG
jgi:hypothetical protein